MSPRLGTPPLRPSDGPRASDELDLLFVEAGLAWLKSRSAVLATLAEGLGAAGPITATRLRLDRRLGRALNAWIAFATAGRHGDGEAALLSGLELSPSEPVAPAPAQPATELWRLRLSWWQRFGGASPRPRLLDRLVAASARDPRRLGAILIDARRRLEDAGDSALRQDLEDHQLQLEDPRTGKVLAISAGAVRGVLSRLSWLKGPEGSHAVAGGRVFRCDGDAPQTDAGGILVLAAGEAQGEADALIVRPFSSAVVVSRRREARS